MDDGMARAKKIALFFGHVSSNIGDVAINGGTINLLYDAFPGAHITAVLLGVENSPHLESSESSFGEAGEVSFSHFSGNAESAIEYAMNPEHLLSECGVEDADIVVIAAGEHIFDYNNKDNSRNLFWRTLPVFSAYATGKRCIILPSTFGPFETEEARLLINEISERGPRMAVRDNGSINELKRVLPAADFDSLLDPAFFLKSVNNAVHEVGQEADKLVVGIVMRSEGWGLRLPDAVRIEKNRDFEESKYQSSLSYQFSLELVRNILSKTNGRARFFVQIEADRPVAEAVLEKIKEENVKDSERVEIVTPESINAYLAELAKVSCVVASRFHALVMGLVSHTPVFGVYFEAHAHKIPGLFDLLGHQERCINLNAISVEEAAGSVLDNFINLPASFSTYETAVKGLRFKTEKWLKETLHDQPGTDESRGPAYASLMYGARLFLTIEKENALRRMRTKANQYKRKYEEIEKEAIKIKASESSAMRMLSGLKKENENLHRDLICLKQEKEEADVRVQREARRASGFERRLEMCRQSTSFKLGNVFVQCLKSPSEAMKLPARVWRLWASRGKNKIENLSSDENIVKLFKEKGVDAVSFSVASSCNGSGKEKARELIKVAKLLKMSGYPEAEYPLIQKAAESDKSEVTLRALYWAATKSYRFNEARECAKSIMSLYGSKPTKEQKEFLEKYRRSPVSQLSILDSIPSSVSSKIEPIPGRLCYILHNSLPYSSGGYATRAHGIALGLKSHGMDVVGISRPGYPLDIKHELSRSQVPLRDIVDGVEYHRTLSPLRSDYPATQYMQKAADALTDVIARMRPAYVMAASNHVTALPALIASRRLGIPFFYEVRGFWEITRVSREPEFVDTAAFKAQEILEAEVAKCAEHVFTLTGPMKNELIRRGVDKDDITILPNSCDPTVFSPRPRDEILAERLGIPNDVPVIGYIGTFVQYEGLEDLVAAAALLKERGHVFRLLIVGNENASGIETGPITAEINRIAAESNLDGWLIMPGRVPHEEVASYYSLIDISPFPRKPQPVTELVSPMKPLEAFSMEKAVVVSSVAALAEMVQHGETGLIYEKGNIESLANTLLQLVSDPALCKRLGTAGRRWVETERTWVLTAGKAAEKIMDTVVEVI